MLLDEENGPDIPSVVVIDPVSGYSANIPVTKQGYPFWWETEPDTYARILDLRKRHGLTVDDGIETFAEDFKTANGG